MKKTVLAVLLIIPTTAIVAAIGWGVLPPGFLRDKSKDVAVDEVVDLALDYLEVPTARRSAVKARLMAGFDPAERIEEAAGLALTTAWLRRCWPDIENAACQVATAITVHAAHHWAAKREWPEAFRGAIRETEHLNCDGSNASLDNAKEFLVFNEMEREDTKVQQAEVFKREVLVTYACNSRSTAKR